MNTMEPPSENRPTIETARERGRQRLDKALNFIAPIFDPATLVEVGRFAVQDRVDALKQRVETKATEIRNAVAEKMTAAYDRLQGGFNATKDKTVAVAKEVGRRAAVVGLTPVARAESLYEEMYKIPAGIRESIADRQAESIQRKKDAIKALEAKSVGHREKADEIRKRAEKKNVARKALERVKATG